MLRAEPKIRGAPTDGVGGEAKKMRCLDFAQIAGGRQIRRPIY